MMQSKQTMRRSSLEIKFTYALEGAAVRPHPWSKDKQYQPAGLTFTLESSGTHRQLPDYANLKVGNVKLTGYTLTKSGTPGQRSCQEAFYSKNAWLPWMIPLIEEAVWKTQDEALNGTA